MAGFGDSVVLWVGNPGSGPGNAKLIVFHTRFHYYYYNDNDIYYFNVTILLC